MKKSLFRNALWIAALSVSLSLVCPIYGAPPATTNSEITNDKSSDDSDDSDTTADVTSSVNLLNKAHSLLVKFSDLGTDPKTTPERKKLLERARNLIWKVAPDEDLYHGSRKAASLDILAALKAMKQDAPDEKNIADHIRRADSELRTAISSGAKASASST